MIKFNYGGGTKTFPKPIEELLSKRIGEQFPTREVEETCIRSTFYWSATEEGHSFWNSIIGHDDYSSFQLLYPDSNLYNKGDAVLVADVFELTEGKTILIDFKPALWNDELKGKDPTRLSYPRQFVIKQIEVFNRLNRRYLSILTEDGYGLYLDSSNNKYIKTII